MSRENQIDVCGRCQYYQTKGADFGECRATAPRSPTTYGGSYWPEVPISAWCRMYREISPTTKAREKGMLGMHTP